MTRPALLVALALLMGGGCDREGYRCRATQQCVLRGVAGVCEAVGRCSFPDPGCAAGRRFGSHGGALADRCVEARRCGDGRLDPGEECDDGNPDDRDGCTARCVRCGARDGDAAFLWSQTGACYTRHDTPATFSGAVRACGERGGHLATFTSIYEQSAIENALMAGTTAANWVGLSDRSSQGQFQWLTEEPVLIAPWVGGRPSKTEGRPRCASIARIDGPDAGVRMPWRDEACSERLGYLCERHPAAVRPTDGHAYRTIHESFRWRDAVAACAAMGGHLAVITSEEEHAFVTAHVYGGVWLGANDLDVEGRFLWVTGEPFAFTRFAAAEPDNFGGHHDCLIVAGDRLWHDRPCTERYGALCELE